MIFRLSQQLCTKIKAGRLSEMPLDQNPYADWSCHIFSVDRTQYILLSNTISLYSCVMYGRGVTNDGVFIERALSTIREFMQDDGQQFAYRRFIAPAGGTVRFARALNRSVTGSMSDLIHHATAWLVEADISPHEVGFKLNGVLVSALGDATARPYGSPSEAFKLLAGKRTAPGDDEP